MYTAKLGEIVKVYTKSISNLSQGYQSIADYLEKGIGDLRLIFSPKMQDSDQGSVAARH